jgi:hypothetical protein
VQFFEKRQTEPISSSPYAASAASHTQEMIEMAAFEEFGLLGRELGHAHDYP